MKKSLLHKAEKLRFVLVVLFLVLLVTDSFGQNQKTSDMTNNKYALQNLETEIQSINGGIEESAYRFIDEDALIKQPKVETESDLRALIGLALFRMNREKGLNELQRLTIEVIITAIYKTI